MINCFHCKKRQSIWRMGEDLIQLIDMELRVTGFLRFYDVLMGPFNCLSQTGGPYYEVLLGRRDSIIANYTAANTVLPSPTFNVSALSTKFAAVGLSEVDMVTLSGISHSSPHGKSRKNSSGVFKISSTLFSKKRNAHIYIFCKVHPNQTPE